MSSHGVKGHKQNGKSCKFCFFSARSRQVLVLWQWLTRMLGKLTRSRRLNCGKMYIDCYMLPKVWVVTI